MLCSEALAEGKTGMGLGSVANRSTLKAGLGKEAATPAPRWAGQDQVLLCTPRTQGAGELNKKPFSSVSSREWQLRAEFWQGVGAVCRNSQAVGTEPCMRQRPHLNKQAPSETRSPCVCRWERLSMLVSPKTPTTDLLEDKYQPIASCGC